MSVLDMNDALHVLRDRQDDGTQQEHSDKPDRAFRGLLEAVGNEAQNETGLANSCILWHVRLSLGAIEMGAEWDQA
jgi:hypothetical protein